MVTISVICPHCGQSESVRRYGTNRSGTSRCYCNTCRCAFTLNPRPRQLDAEKAALIQHALQQKTPVSTICRMFKVSPKTVYALMRGSRIALCLMFGLEENFWKRDMRAPKPLQKTAARMEPLESSKSLSVSSPRLFSRMQNGLVSSL